MRVPERERSLPHTPTRCRCEMNELNVERLSPLDAAIRVSVCDCVFYPDAVKKFALSAAGAL